MDSYVHILIVTANNNAITGGIIGQSADVTLTGQSLNANVRAVAPVKKVHISIIATNAAAWLAIAAVA